MAIIGIMASLSLVVFGDQVAKSRHKKNVSNDTSWLQSIQNTATKQNKVCVIKINKLESKALPDNSFSSISPDEYCDNISPYEFLAAIDVLRPSPGCGSDSNNLFIIFSPNGVLPCGGELLLKSDTLRNGQSEIRCINVLPPLGVIRQGLQTQATASGESCDYKNAF